MSRILQAAIVALATTFTLAYGGKIEGRYFPVAIDNAVTRAEAVGSTHTRIWGTAKRIRNCTFSHIEWYLGTKNRSVRIDVEFEDAAVIRPSGDFSYGPWVIHLTPSQLPRSYAVVFHRCHPFWLTESPFHP